MDGAFGAGQLGQDRGGPGGRGAGRGGARSGFRGTAENAKTKICTRWQDGDCRFGDRCNFAHGEHELRGHTLDQGAGGGGGQGAWGGRGYGGGGGGGRGGGGMGAPGRGYGGGGRGAYGGGYPGGAGYQAGGYNGLGQPAGATPMQSFGAGQTPGAPPGMPEEVWAAQGYPVAGPNGWCMYRTKDTAECYFHNAGQGVTTWDRPQDWPAGFAGVM